MSVPQDVREVISSLSTKHSEEKIAEMVYEQLIKDFNTAGIVIAFPAGLNYKNWSGEIGKILRSSSDHQLATLLYAVDIPEKMSAAINGTEAFAELILYREFVKIYFRLHYNL